MYRITRTLTFALLLALTAARAGAASPAPITLEHPTYDIAVNPDTGLVAGIEPDGDTVRFYPNLSSGKSLNGATALTVPKAPIDIVFKRFGKDAFFVVACHDANSLVLIDAATLKTVKEIPVTTPEPSSVIASLNPNDPYVYYCGARGHESRMCAVDLRVQKEVGVVELGGQPGSVMDAAISADGTIVYVRGPWSPSGFSCSSLIQGETGQPPKAAQIIYQHESTAMYFPDPFGQVVAAGKKIYTRDLKTILATVDATPLCFLPNKPLILAMDQSDLPPDLAIRMGQKPNQLLVISANTYKTLATISLNDDAPAPEPGGAAGGRAAAPRGGRGGTVRGGASAPNLTVRNSQADFKGFAYHTHFVADAKNDNLLIANSDSIRVVPVTSLGASAEPFLFASIDGRTQLSIDTPATFKVTLKDAAAKIELKQAPTGMTLQNNTLSWTPGSNDVGAQTVTFRLSAGGVEKMQTLSLRVTRGGITLPFTPQLFTLAPDAASALIAQIPNPNNFGDRNNAPQNSRLVIVDTKTGAIQADRTLSAVTGAIALDAQFVYVALRESEAFYVLNRKDLSDVKRLFCTGHVTRFLPLSGKLIFQTDANAVSVLKTPDFSVIESAASLAPPPNTGRVNRSLEGELGNFGDSVFVNGLVFDNTLTTIKAATQLDGFRSVRFDARNPSADMNNNNSPRSASPWSAWVETNGGALHRSSGQVISQFSAVASLILPNEPVVASVVTGNGQRDPDSPTTKAELVLREVITGGSQIRLPLFDEPAGPNSNQQGMGGQPQVIDYAAGRIAVSLRGSLYVVPLPAITPDKFPKPLTFKAEQGIPVLVSDKPATIPFSALGGEAPVEYSLTREMPGIEINKANGSLTIEAGALVDLALNSLLTTGRVTDPNTGEMISETDVPSYIKSSAARFKTFTGHDPGGVPVAITLTVTARDKNLAAVNADRVVLVEIPTERVDKALKDRVAVASPPARGNSGPAGGTTRPTSNDAARIDALEHRIDLLEAKIDLLTKLLGDKAK